MTLLTAFDNEMGEAAFRIVRHLTQAGYASYFVGGCVRDAVLERAVKDIDIATSARPEQVMELFPGAIPTGLQHGTVTIPHGAFHFEVTTFRTESGYSDGRRPDTVSFIDEIEGDLARRDFTVNAMALDLDGRLIDPFGGVDDIQAKLLRAVGHPLERFREDALRMLRCIRFASEYGFRIEERTWQEAVAEAPGLARVAMERVRSELDRLLSGWDPARGIELLAESQLLRWCKERLRMPADLGLQEQPADDPLRMIGTMAEPLARWAFWFHRMGLTPDDAAFACGALKTSNAFADAVRQLLAVQAALAGAPMDSARPALLTAALQYGPESAARWLEWCRTLHRHPEYQWMELYASQGRNWLQGMTVAYIRELDLNGQALMHHFAKKGGPWIKDILNRLLREAALGMVENKREPLLARAREIINANEKGNDGSR